MSENVVVGSSFVVVSTAAVDVDLVGLEGTMMKSGNPVLESDFRRRVCLDGLFSDVATEALDEVD